MRVFAQARKAVPKTKPGGIAPALFYGMFAVLFATNVLTAVAFLMAPDIARLLSGRASDVVAAYESRITQLRVEVDRLHSRNFAQAGDMNLQMQELTQQQEVLLEQQELVRQLARKAEELGLGTRSVTAAQAAEGLAGVAETPKLLSYVDTSIVPVIEDAGADMAASVAGMMAENRATLAVLAEAAADSTESILGELNGLGIRPALPSGLESMGGPLLPERTASEQENLLSEANDALLQLARLQVARDAAAAAPVHRPLVKTFRTSSGFGNRRDPFTGGRAFHSGLDFPAPTGTVVVSAAPGRVSFVGQRSGYGNLVEVTHPSGLVTRYGHLDSFIARKGDRVLTGTPIARVGSTGRSTGPHLHFEVRRNDDALDPARFLSAGQRLQRLMGS